MESTANPTTDCLHLWWRQQDFTIDGSTSILHSYALLAKAIVKFAFLRNGAKIIKQIYDTKD